MFLSELLSKYERIACCVVRVLVDELSVLRKARFVDHTASVTSAPIAQSLIAETAMHGSSLRQIRSLALSRALEAV